jgi:hypothetical protein
LLIIFFSLEGQLRVKFSGPDCLGEAVNLQLGLGAFLKQSVFFVTLGDKHKHFMVCCSNQMSIGQLLADVRAKVCLFCSPKGLEDSAQVSTLETTPGDAPA